MALREWIGATYMILLMASVVHGQENPRVSISLEVTFEEHADAPLTRVLQVIGSATGEAWVIDSRDDGVLNFSASGTYLNRIGRVGEGPGEFLARTRAGTWGDTLWVYDSRMNRTTWFTPEGAPRTTEPPRSGDPFVQHLASLGGAVALSLTGRTLDDMHLSLVLENGDTLAHRRIDWGRRNLAITVGNFRRVLSNPFSSGSLVGISDDSRHFAVVTQPKAESATHYEYGVCVFNAQGRRNWCTTVEYRPEPLRRQMLDDWLAGMPPLPQSVSKRLFQDAVRAGLDDITYLPPVRATRGTVLQSVLLGSGGGLALIRRSEESWDVVSLAGREGVVRAPQGYELHAIAGDFIWGVRNDAVGVPQIARFRLER